MVLEILQFSYYRDSGHLPSWIYINSKLLVADWVWWATMCPFSKCHQNWSHVMHKFTFNGFQNGGCPPF